MSSKAFSCFRATNLKENKIQNNLNLKTGTNRKENVSTVGNFLHNGPKHNSNKKALQLRNLRSRPLLMLVQSSRRLVATDLKVSQNKTTLVLRPYRGWASCGLPSRQRVSQRTQPSLYLLDVQVTLCRVSTIGMRSTLPWWFSRHFLIWSHGVPTGFIAINPAYIAQRETDFHLTYTSHTHSETTP